MWIRLRRNRKMKYLYQDLIVWIIVIAVIVSLVLLRYFGNKSKNEASDPAENLNASVRQEDKNSDIKKLNK
jgi:uncharacterized membrane protein YvbJ